MDELERKVEQLEAQRNEEAVRYAALVQAVDALMARVDELERRLVAPS